ncbi:MAG: HD domain-containing phosphohydrolase [Bryobacteraceae bacterium]
MAGKILCVDDEPHILQGFQRQLRRFDLVTALGPEAGLEAMRERGPFEVVVSDHRMPGMTGVQFLNKAKEIAPDCVRMMLTGEADLSAAAQAVNEGNVFRLLLKPCPSDVLAKALESGLEQYRLVHAERQLLEQTLHGSIEVLSDILSLVNPEAFGRGHRIRNHVRQIARKLTLANGWQYEIAAMLSPIGCVALPGELLDKVRDGEPLSDAERRLYATRYQVGYELLAKIPRLELIARMIQAQEAAPKTSPPSESAEEAALGGQMLRLAAHFDAALMSGASHPVAIETVRASGRYDPKLVDALADDAKENEEMEVRSARVAELHPGMVLQADSRTRDGLLLVARGQQITPSVIARLRSFSSSPRGVAEPLVVLVAASPKPWAEGSKAKGGSTVTPGGAAQEAPRGLTSSHGGHGGSDTVGR